MEGITGKILIVDDDENISEVINMYLKSTGYNTKTATNGKEAQTAYLEYNPDLVLLDVMIPVIDGIDLLKWIRKQGEKPVIMLTAVSEEQKIVSGLKLGADDYIVKPFVLPNLLARIEAVLRRSNWNKKEAKAVDMSFTSDEPIEELTQREKEVLSMVAKGGSNSEIAKKLFLKEVTVKTHLSTIFKKLKVTNRTQAVLLAMQMNIISE